MKNESSIKKIEKKNSNLDFGMLITILILLCMGLVMVSTASSYHALSTYGDSNFLLTRQLVFGGAGIIAMFIISKVNYRIYKKWSYLGYAVAILLLIAVLTPLGQTRNGAKRWLGFGDGDGFVFQPSEIMKMMLVLATATYISLNTKKLNSIKGYIVPILLLVGVVVVMFLQKHMSGTLVMIVASMSIIFASGIKIKVRYILGIILVRSVSTWRILVNGRV